MTGLALHIAKVLGSGRLAPKGSFKRCIGHVVAYMVLTTFSAAANADFDWVSVTLDNDVFVGDDSGYTNGLYMAIFDVGLASNDMPDADVWTSPLMWSMPRQRPLAAINAYSFGQAMITPQDISKEIPDDNDLPYSGMLFASNTYIAMQRDIADRVSTTIGVVGPASGAEKTQKFIHQVLGSREPKGWDTQLKNEIVFQFSRARLWRGWVSALGNSDLLLRSELNAGTIFSSVLGAAMIRYGRQLGSSYATPLFASARTANPASIDGGWYFYAGVQASYLFNQIAADGNTFRDSRSVSYERATLGLSAGLAYSWKKTSLTLGVNDTSILEDRARASNQDLTRYGTLTLARSL